MNNKLPSMAFAALLCAHAASAVFAASTTPATSAEAPDRTPGAVKKTAPVHTVANSKAKAKVKPVDINGANKAALMKLPGITASLADKIIDNRPYGSKTWLLTNNVIEASIFYGIKPLVEAKQPYKTVEENAAFYEKMKKEKAAKP
jgi:DNA uptake protein ComE-like DNA-binding protein